MKRFSWINFELGLKINFEMLLTNIGRKKAEKFGTQMLKF